MLQSPTALFIMEYHNPSPVLLKPVALREYKNIQSGRNPSAVCSKKCKTCRVAPCGHVLFLPVSRPGLMFNHQYLDSTPPPHTHTHCTLECILMYVQSRDLESRWCRHPALCAGRWREPSPGHRSLPAAEWQRCGLGSQAER